MALIRLFAVVAMLAIAVVVPASSQQPHWLIGSWKGELGGMSSSVLYGIDRVLKITAVDPSGASAKATWLGPQLTQPVTLTISGDNVSFVTPGTAGNTYKMTRKGDVLDGIWQNSGNGRSGPLSLKKQ